MARIYVPYKGKRDVKWPMNARLKLSTLFTVHSPMFHRPLFVHKWTCEIRSKKGSERAVPDTFQQPDIYWRHKNDVWKCRTQESGPKFGLILTRNSCLILTQVRTGMWCCWRRQVHNNFIRHGFGMWNACEMADASFVGSSQYVILALRHVVLCTILYRNFLLSNKRS